ncbi:MAG: bifunctional glutamate N-acetyltransferase/amino-acid acetyltransferase ArgJ [Clostridia bacterium]|nr:bifunctional glutamate N-acetyltransferase/amino-acid acetyltransferase ArgJ [Clostridia bacterium]
MNVIPGGVCAAKGFQASGVHCGVRKNKLKKDLALIYSPVRCAAAAVYTQNLVKGAPIAVTKANIADGYAQAVVCNSGNANTCNANGIEIAEGMCDLTAKALGIDAKDVIVASTGVIGQPMSLEPFVSGIPAAAKELGANNADAAEAIMTTDVVKKEQALSFEIGCVECKIGGMAKGSGMIHPNMATMLVFITTDCAISPEMLQKALSHTVDYTFNMISVDGDTSTNDTCAVMASGMAGNEMISSEGEDYDAFCAALYEVMKNLSRSIAADGEGASKLLECTVSGAADLSTARTAAKAVICSSLVKAAMFGSDANWGRVLCAVGYCGKELDVNKIDVDFESAAGSIPVCRMGAGVDFSEEKAKEILLEKEIHILVNLNSGSESATAWGCDLTYDYVKINGDYRT